jgi:hypothetical protein
MADETAIREAVENWVVWRDQGNWECFRRLWHPNGRMIATWFQGDADQFIEASKASWAKDTMIHHFLGGTSIQVCDGRAVVQTRMTISVRAPVHDVLCDVTCTGRFYDFFEKVSGRWLLLLRQLIYEKDRLDPVNVGDWVCLDSKLLARFPAGYQHLAYLQTNTGHKVFDNLPGLRGPEVERLYAAGAEWLSSHSNK